MRHSFPDPAKELVLAKFTRKVNEWLLAGLTACFGFVMLVVPKEHLSSMIVDSMMLLLPQLFWAIMFFTLGLLRMFCLCVNGWWPHSPKVRYWFSVFTLFSAWLPMTLSFVVGSLVLKGLFYAISLTMPFIVACEAMTMLTLKTWIEINRGNDG